MPLSINRGDTNLHLRILLVVFYALDSVEPYHQHFSLRNYTLQYPYTVHETVPVPLLFVLNTLIPALVIAIYALLIDGLFSRHKEAVPRDGHRTLGKYRLKDRLWELNCGLLGLLLSQGAAFVITGALKNATGKPRPDLIDRCQPLTGSADAPVYGLSNYTICTQKDHKMLKDGFRSFPSGHSSSAFAGLFYLSIYLAAKMHVLDNRGEVWKTFIVLIPTLGAALIAISRIMDARHHPFDVISGSLLGTVVAWAAYRQYFPPATESWRKGRAYPIRTWGKEPKVPGSDQHDLIQEEGDEPAQRSRASPLDAAGDRGGNVFRQQISQTQYRRENGLTQLPNQSSTSSMDIEGRRPRNPLPGSQRRVRQVHSDGYWSSSSDHSLNEDAFELRPVPARADHGPTNVSPAQALGQDTSYRRPNQDIGLSTPFPRAENSGPTPGAFAPNPLRDAPMTSDEHDIRGQKPRGVDLVETYR
ncbi:MAG: hypothetical protein LQ343_001296 [Gyalolechia ehrenbergii]|nr:MAG: hypothetical protein LQ343_001296 [Gyalolechia ehrenbergii]